MQEHGAWTLWVDHTPAVVVDAIRLRIAQHDNVVWEQKLARWKKQQAANERRWRVAHITLGVVGLLAVATINVLRWLG